MGKTIDIGGIPVTVGTEEECEQVEYAVCVRKADDPGYFDDNLEGVCTNCQEEIIFRPYMPKTPTKICINCLSTVIGEENARLPQ